jgi:hypothetical protein
MTEAGGGMKRALNRRFQIRLGPVSKKLLIVLLVILVLFVALPLGMGMAMGMCSTSHSLTCSSAVGTCAVFLGLMFLVLIAVLGTVTDGTPRAPILLLARPLDRPPRAFSF